jgi:hypothetical protein
VQSLSVLPLGKPKIVFNNFTHIQCLQKVLGPYDFHDVEKTDGITEFGIKNGINCKM